MVLSKVFIAFLAVVAIGVFNALAILIVAGRNPVMSGGFNFRTRRWALGRHKDNLFSKLFGYVWAAGIFYFDFLILREILHR